MLPGLLSTPKPALLLRLTSPVPCRELAGLVGLIEAAPPIAIVELSIRQLAHSRARAGDGGGKGVVCDGGARRGGVVRPMKERRERWSWRQFGGNSEAKFGVKSDRRFDGASVVADCSKWDSRLCVKVLVMHLAGSRGRCRMRRTALRWN